MASNVPKTYITLNRNLISKELIGFLHEQNMELFLTVIKKEAEIFRFLLLVYGATISRFPLLNILASGKNIPVSVLGIVDCNSNLAEDNRKHVAWK